MRLALLLAVSITAAHAQPAPRERLDAYAERCGRVAQPSDTVASDPALRRELRALAVADQADRAFTVTLGTADPPAAQVRAMSTADTLRTARLREIVAADGWPDATRVGRDGLAAAFLLLQHSPDAVLQALLLPDVTAGAARGDLDGEAVALLTDRVRIHAGLPQLYGTQARPAGDTFEPQPLADADHVDDRRAALCLMPLDLYLLVLEEMYGVRDHGLLGE